MLPKRVPGKAHEEEMDAMEGLTIGEIARLRRMREESNKITDTWDVDDYEESEVK